jgi:ABC-type uncharacterized transport system substrate-binding protein
MRAATTTIPIVAAIGGDPVSSGHVASLNRPGGNLTGVALFAYSLGPKRLEVLRELIPNAKLIAVLGNPGDSRLRGRQQRSNTVRFVRHDPSCTHKIAIGGSDLIIVRFE